MPKSKSGDSAELYEHVLGTSPRIVDKSDEAGRLLFDIGLPAQGSGPSAISIRSEENVSDQDWLRDHGTGIRGLILAVTGREDHGEEMLGTEGIASTISLKW